MASPSGTCPSSTARTAAGLSAGAATGPATRAEALARRQAFLPAAAPYAEQRSFVRPGHPGVSRLSGAIRHRVVLERELIDSLLATHRFGAIDKLVQELCWRGSRPAKAASP